VSERCSTGLDRNNEPESFSLLAKRGLEIHAGAKTPVLSALTLKPQANFPMRLWSVDGSQRPVRRTGWTKLLNAYKKEPQFIH
jgi:hypothetical protein